VGASDLQASPLAERDRSLWAIYIKRRQEVQGARTSGGEVVRLGGRGQKEAGQDVSWGGARNRVFSYEMRRP